MVDTRTRGKGNRISAARLCSLDELDGRTWDGGYAEVEERLSAA